MKGQVCRYGPICFVDDLSSGMDLLGNRSDSEESSLNLQSLCSGGCKFEKLLGFNHGGLLGSTAGVPLIYFLFFLNKLIFLLKKRKVLKWSTPGE